MGALGNALFAVSQSIFQYGQITLDLSHMGTIIGGIYGGPLIGLLSGALVGLGPGLYYGFLTPVGGLGILGLWGLPFGKALTGLSIGLLASIIRRRRSRMRFYEVVAAVMLGYVPEAIYTVFFFRVLVFLFLPSSSAAYMSTLVVPILAKGSIEMGIMSFFTSSLTGNVGFSQFVERFIPRKV
jgi:LytS/YehU family sensor histidine kinase